jgi:hypothetical protein
MCRLRRDDGADTTLLRERPTNSRASDVFVKPPASVGGADVVEFLYEIEGDTS